MGGWNTKSVMSPNLLVVDRNKQARASPCDRATLPYHSYTTTIPPIALLYHKYHFYIIPLSSHSSLCWAPLGSCCRQMCENCLRLFGHRPLASALPFFLSRQSFGYGPRAKRSRSATRAGLVGYRFETAHNAIAPMRQPGAYSRELGSVAAGSGRAADRRSARQWFCTQRLRHCGCPAAQAPAVRISRGVFPVQRL